MSENQKNYYFWNQGRFREAVRSKVCPTCEYFNLFGPCRDPDPRGCAMLRYLPQLVIAAQHLEKPDLEHYVEGIEREIREECGASPESECELHRQLVHDLKSRLTAALDAILETDRILECRGGFGEAG